MGSVYVPEPRQVDPAGTHDFASPVEMMKVIDQAMRCYFEADDWLSIRNRLFPGLRSSRSVNATSFLESR